MLKSRKSTHCEVNSHHHVIMGGGIHCNVTMNEIEPLTAIVTDEYTAKLSHAD